MRQIKFRGLDTEGVWHYGNLLQSKPFKDGRIDCYIQPKSILCLGTVSTPTSSFVRVIEKTVGQSTGITDKNGVEIYQDDVAHNSCDRFCRVGVVQMLHGCLMVARDDECYLNLYFFHGKVEVIGNIHQQPELME